MFTHKIVSIEPKNGEMRDVHKHALGALCDFMYLNPKAPALITYLPEGEDEAHVLQTSHVLSITLGFNRRIVETKNTVYTFERM